MLLFSPFFLGCCNASRVSGCTVLLFASKIFFAVFFKFRLLNLPPCFSGVEIFHEFHFSFFSSSLLRFPHCSAILHEFPPEIFPQCFIDAAMGFYEFQFRQNA
jgi:hypothetical protein